MSGAAAKEDKEMAKSAPDLGLLEEDDEFEEFPAEGEFSSGAINLIYNS